MGGVSTVRMFTWVRVPVSIQQVTCTVTPLVQGKHGVQSKTQFSGQRGKSLEKMLVN